MTKTDLTAALAYHCGGTLLDASKAVDVMFTRMGEALARGEQVKIQGFGTLAPSTHKGRRPSKSKMTGVMYSVSPHRVVRLRPGKKLKAMLKL